MDQVGERWGLQPRAVRQVARDGWLELGLDGAVPLQDVVDLEAMHMPEVWRRRQAAGPRAQMTPYVDPQALDRPSLGTVMRALGVGRANAYRLLAEGVMILDD